MIVPAISRSSEASWGSRRFGLRCQVSLPSLRRLPKRVELVRVYDDNVECATGQQNAQFNTFMYVY